MLSVLSIDGCRCCRSTAGAVAAAVLSVLSVFREAALVYILSQGLVYKKYVRYNISNNYDSQIDATIM